MLRRTLNPGEVVLLSFVSAALLGSVLLTLPAATVSGSLRWIDAFFMATSAVCVTGLSVIDLGSEFTRFGQCVMLLLIQTGGLGIMTFSVFLMMLFRQKISLTSRLSIGLEPHQNQTRNLFHILFFVLAMVFSFEALGAALIYVRLKTFPGESAPLFSSVFHSVSAFCNAGFGLYKDSLIQFQREYYLPAVMAFLIIVGGLGFMLIDELRLWLQALLTRRHHRLSLHTRICLSFTAVLLVLGAAAILFLEWNNMLVGLAPAQKLMNAFFLSATSRTAGFNTLDTGSLTNSTLMILLWLMFIGGCPGSAAGGIKVSTFAALISLIFGKLSGRESAVLFERRIPAKAISRALAIFASGFIVINLATLFFHLTERIDVSHHLAKGSFLDLLFEATSAFGTVGLSTGLTPTFSDWGKAGTIVLMFAGRLGPLTLGIALLTRQRAPAYDFVEEDIAIG